MKKIREIEDLNKLVLDKDYVVKDCQDQLGHLLEKDYNDVRVSVYRDNMRHIVQSLRLNISHVFSACFSVSSIKEYLISCCLHVSQIDNAPVISSLQPFLFCYKMCESKGQMIHSSLMVVEGLRNMTMLQDNGILCVINLLQFNKNMVNSKSL